MNRRQRSRTVGGALLILVGAILFAAQFAPNLPEWVISWPLIIVGVAIFLLVLGLLSGSADMAVPACIVGGIGGLLYYQNASGDWDSWAYVWTLIPGFVGLGIVLAGLLAGRTRRSIREGGWLIVISLVLFAVFGSFLGGGTDIGTIGAVALILVGVLVLLRPLLQRR